MASPRQGTGRGSPRRRPGGLHYFIVWLGLVCLSSLLSRRRSALPENGVQVRLWAFPDALDLTANALAIALRVPGPRINDVVREKRGITPDTALRLARYFGTTGEFWLNLQISYDLKMVEAESGKQIKKEVLPHAA